MFVLILFVIMGNKENGYILNLSPSAGGSLWILAICALRIMKTGLGMAASLSFEFDRQSSHIF
jgi:hypothetical protein